MRIAILTLSFWPKRAGMEYVVHDLSSALHELGHEVYVFAPNVKGDFQEIDHNYHLIRFGLKIPGAFRYGLNRLLLLLKIRNIHRFNSIDIINVHMADFAASYALNLKKAFGIPVVVTCHGGDIQRVPDIRYGLRLNKKKDKKIRGNLKKADMVIAISDSMFDELREIVPEDKIAKIPHGVELETLQNKSTENLRKTLGVSNEIIVLSVGRNVPKKAFDVGLRAFAIVAKQEKNVIYVHIGRGGGPLEKLASVLGVKDRFFALGALNRENVLSSYKDADIFFSPAIIESFGIVTYEAMSAGCACVLSDGPGNRDAIRDESNGLIVPVGDENAMAKALLSLIQNPDKREQLGKSALKHAQSLHNWATVADIYTKNFSKLLY